MNDKLMTLAKNFMDKVAGRNNVEDEEMSRARLQKLSEQTTARAQELLKRVEEQAAQAEEQSILEKQLRTSQRIELAPGSNQPAAQSGISRWSKNSDRYLRQQIRTGEQLSGVAIGFDIDPISKMPKENHESTFK